MTKKEKIIAFCFILSFFTVLTSCVYTLYLNKPENSHFAIEKLFVKKF